MSRWIRVFLRKDIEMVYSYAQNGEWQIDVQSALVVAGKKHGCELQTANSTTCVRMSQRLELPVCTRDSALK